MCWDLKVLTFASQVSHIFLTTASESRPRNSPTQPLGKPKIVVCVPLTNKVAYKGAFEVLVVAFCLLWINPDCFLSVVYNEQTDVREVSIFSSNSEKVKKLARFSKCPEFLFSQSVAHCACVCLFDKAYLSDWCGMPERRDWFPVCTLEPVILQSRHS